MTSCKPVSFSRRTQHHGVSQLVFVILLVVSDIYEGRHDSDASYSFSSETVNTAVIKCTYIVGTSFTNMRLFFHKFSISNTFLHLCVRFCMPIA